MLAINIVCLNLSSMIVFVIKGVIPRRWLDKERAKRAKVRVIAVWILALVVLVLLSLVYNRTLELPL